MPKGVRVDWFSLDARLRALAASGLTLSVIAERLEVNSRALSAHAKRIGVVIQNSDGRPRAPARPATVVYEAEARGISSLAELVPSASLREPKP